VVNRKQIAAGNQLKEHDSLELAPRCQADVMLRVPLRQHSKTDQQADRLDYREEAERRGDTESIASPGCRRRRRWS
jgi:hypothetical protein